MRRSTPNDVWSQLLSVSAESVADDLWVAVIRSAALHLAANGHFERDSEYPVEDAAENALTDWLLGSVPLLTDAALAMGDGVHVFVERVQLPFDELFRSFSGPACGFVEDAMFEMREARVDISTPNSINPESVEEFFSEWRHRFLTRVVEEVRAYSESRSVGGEEAR